MPNFEVLRQAISFEAAITLFVVLIFRVLYFRLHREEFFWWWSWAFTSYSAALMLSWISLELGQSWTLAKIGVVWAMTLATFLRIPLMVCGAESLLRDRTLSRFNMKIFFGMALLTGSASFLLSLAPFDALTQYAIHTVPCHTFLGVAYFYCGWIFLRRTPKPISVGAKVTALACFLYTAIRFTWSVQILLRVPLWEKIPLNLLDLMSSLAIAFGAVLFLLERYQTQKQRLDLYEKILPTCSLCGQVRDDTGHEHGEGPWVPLQKFVMQHSSTQLSHTLCPACLLDFRRQEGMD